MGQMNPQFQAGVLNNPQLPMPPFPNSNSNPNPNPFFAPNQFFPFPQPPFQNLNANNLPPPFPPPQNAVNPAQFLPNWPLNLPNFVQNVTQLLQMQMMNIAPQDFSAFINAQAGGGSSNGVLPQPVNGNGGLTYMDPNNAITKDIGNGSHHAQRNWDTFSHGAAESQVCTYCFLSLLM